MSNDTLGEVKRLLNRMPGVEVALVHLSRDGTWLDLNVRSQPSLARLAFLTSAANVGLQVVYNWRLHTRGELGRDDPAGILYRLEVPGLREPDPGGSSTTLQILGLCLVDFVREKGLIEESEGERLERAFNNHDG